MRRLLACSVGLVASIPLLSLSAPASAEEVATPCEPGALTCAAAPVAFSKELELPIDGGFDTGWVPQGSPLQVHFWAQLYATSFVNLAGELETSWPEALALEAVPKPGAGALGIHYGVDIGGEAMVQVEVLGQTYTWTGPIPYVPQFDFQVDSQTDFDPWAFDGLTVGGSTMQETLFQVDVTSFIGVNIPGLSGGIELDVKMDLDATYRTNQIRVFEPDGMLVAGGAILSDSPPVTSALYLGGPSVEYDVQPVGSIVYDGTLHLVPAFYIDTIGPDFSIPVADIPIPFSIEQKDWTFDPARVHVPLPDIELPADDSSPQTGEFGLPENGLDFGQVWVGTSAPLALQVHNLGEADLVYSIAATDAAFVTTASELTLTPGANASIIVNFEPQTAGEVSATLVIASNDPDEPTREVALHGLAVDQGTDADPPAPTGDEPDEDDGCNCRQAGGASGSGAGLAFVGLALALAARRRAPARALRGRAS